MTLHVNLKPVGFVENLKAAGFVIGTLLIAFITPACGAAQSPRARPAAPSSNKSQDPYAKARVRTIQQINAYRAKVKLPPLEHWVEGDSCADREAKRDSEKNRPHASFGTCDELAQNECPDWPDKDAVAIGCMEQMWNEGPGKDYSRHGHYLNMTNPTYTKVAIGFYTTPEGKVWSVQNFK